MKKIKVNFSQPDEVQAAGNNPNGFVDNSAAELRALQQQMLQRRMQRENDDDPDGMQINVKPAASAADAQKIGALKQMMGAPAPVQPPVPEPQEAGAAEQAQLLGQAQPAMDPRLQQLAKLLKR